MAETRLLFFWWGEKFHPTRMSMKLSNYLVSWVVAYLGDLQPTYIGLIIYLLSTMDIPVLDGFLPPGPTLAGMHSSWLAAGGMLPGGAVR